MRGAGDAAGPGSEDEYQMSEAERRLVIPRRGGTVAEPLVVDPDAARELAAWLESQSSAVGEILDDLYSEADLVREFRASGSLADATPLGAAIAAAFALSPNTAAYENPAGIVDAWVAIRGLEFAVSATLELFAVTVAGHYIGGPLPACLSRNINRQHYTADPTGRFELAARLRLHLVSASEAEYAKACALLVAHRAAPFQQTVPADVWPRVLLSFLMPERVDWVEADFPLHHRSHANLVLQLVLGALTTEHQAASLPAENSHGYWIVRDPAALWTAFDILGPGLLPILATWLTREHDSDTIQALLGMVERMPSDQAFQFLVDNIGRKHHAAAVQNTAKRFPRRALRILADAALRDTPRGLAAANALRRLVVAEEGLVRSELPMLPPAARQLVEKTLAANVRVPEADAGSLPKLFVTPPWLSGTKLGKPVVISGLVAPTEVVLAWQDGEREQWESPAVVENPLWKLDSWEDIAKRITEEGSARWYANAHFAVGAPEDLVHSVLPVWHPDSWMARVWIPRLTIRFGAEALPPILKLAASEPAEGSAFLAPFAAPDAALLATAWLSRLKTARPYALAWLTRHPAVAARTLIPVALGKAGKARSAAELTIHTLAAQGFTAEIAEAAAGYGDAVAEAVAALIADDQALTLPKKMPVLPDWADPQTLPQILLKDRRTALPERSVQHLLLMLAVSKPTEPYTGVLLAKDICDPVSLAAFAWALFEAWRGADYPSKESWAFDALRWFGDDQAVRRLSPLIRLWPGENGHQRAVAGLDVLAAIGGDTALTHLYGISQKAKFKGLRDQATRRVTDIADDLGLSAEQLGDRLVPDLGLEPSGTLSLDYGPRRFTVGFDEQLSPFVVDETGKRRKALPKPGAKDDADLAPAAYQRFSVLKKEARALATSQVQRLELAMVAQRRWTAQEFRDYFLAHPLLRHVVRRLVWATFTDDGIGSAFRVAEDLSLADVSDDEYTLPDDALIGIAHPLHLGAAAAAWSEVFADYEVLQPFAQLARGVYALTDEEKASGTLTRFAGVDVPVGEVLGLERRGWQRGVPQDGGVQVWISRRMPGGGSVTAALDPGIVAGYVTGLGDTQRFSAVFLSDYDDGEPYRRRWEFPALGGLDDVTASEVLRDLTEVTSHA